MGYGQEPQLGGGSEGTTVVMGGGIWEELAEGIEAGGVRAASLGSGQASQ